MSKIISSSFKFLHSHNSLFRYRVVSRFTSSKSEKDTSIKKIDIKEEKLIQKYLKKVRSRGNEEKKKRNAKARLRTTLKMKKGTKSL